MRLFPQPKTVEMYSNYVCRSILENRVQLNNPAMAQQEYALRIDEKGVTVEFSCPQGAYYAELTLSQLLRQQSEEIPCCYIHDAPDFTERCVMIDVSMNRIPTIKTLYRVVDILAAVKINQLQLYFEGFPFAYPSHPKVWKGKDLLTPQEIKELDAYCKERYIELIPTLNAFGHMKHWLVRDEYKHLALTPIDPKGYEMPWGYEPQPSTMDPENPATLEMSKSLFYDILPCFSSNKVNICCDETFELDEEAKKGKDPGKLYFDYLMKIYTLIKDRYPEKTMMFWGDIILKHPEYIPLLPKDLTPMLWQYGRGVPTLEMCQAFSQSGRTFYVCGATMTHCTIVGSTFDMIDNVNHCTVNGLATGAIGCVMTKWQGTGGWDEMSMSYPAFAYLGLQSWHVGYQHDLEGYLNEYVYCDGSGKMAKIALSLGDFKNFDPESWYNGNGIFRVMYYDQLDEEDHDLDFANLPPLSGGYFEKVRRHVELYQRLLEQVDMHCEDAALILKEYRVAMQILMHGVALGEYKHRETEDRAALYDLYDDIQTLICNFLEVWFGRNRAANVDEGFCKLDELKRQYRRRLGVQRMKI